MTSSDHDQYPVPDHADRTAVIRFILLLLLITCTIIAFKVLGLGDYLTQAGINRAIDSIRAFESRFGFLGPVLFWVLASVTIVLNMPGMFIIWFAVMTLGVA